MKCTDVCAALPLLIYGEASPQEQAALKEHLAHCVACRREEQALENVRRLLDAAPVPRVEVDLPRLHHALANQQLQRARHWRRIAYALAGVAALLLLVIGLRLEVRVEAGRMVLCWGDPSPAEATPLPPEPIVKSAALPPESAEAELRVLSELIHALKQDGDDRDRRIEEQLDRLQRHVHALQAQSDQRWTTTEQDMAALYLLARKGDRP